MRPLTAEDEAALRAIAERHGYFAARGPHTGEGSASRLIEVPLGPAEMDEKSSVCTPRPTHNEADRRVPCRTEGLIGPK